MPTRSDIEKMDADATFAESIGLDPEAERARHRAIWESREDPGAGDDEPTLSDRQIAQVLVMGDEDPAASGRALRALGIAITDEQADELLNAAQLGAAKPRDVVSRILSLPRIDPQETDYAAALEAMREGRKGRAVVDPEETSYTVRVTED